MDKKELEKISQVYPQYIAQFERFVPQEENQTFIEKMNSVIDYMSVIGRISNQTVKQWNDVMKWIVDEGLEEMTEAEAIKQFESYKEEADGISSELTSLKADVEEAKEVSQEAKNIGNEIKSNGEFAKSQGDFAKVQGERAKELGDKSEEQYNRLKDTDVGSLSDQLLETLEVTENIKIKGVDVTGFGKKHELFVTFVSDDGQSTDYTILKPIFESEGVPCCMAITTGYTGKPYFDKPISDVQGLELQSMGWEICGHTHNHPALGSGLTEQEVEQQFITNNQILRERGYKVNNLMYPHGSSNNMVERVARKYYRSAFGYGHGAIDTPPFNMFKINRVGLGAWFDATVDNPTKYPEGTRNTFEGYYKPRVDEAIEKGGWLVFGLHSNAPDFTIEQQNYLKQTIQYIKSKGIKIVTVNEALDRIGNVLDVKGYNSDDSKTKHFSIASNGEISTSEIESLDAIDTVLPTGSVTLDTSLGGFKEGRITYCYTNNGMLVTFRKFDDASWQTFTKKDGTIQTRVVDYPNKTWKPWQTIQTLEKMGQKKSWYRTNVTVNANSTLDHLIVGLKSTDAGYLPVASPYGGLPNGISYYTYIGNEAIGNDNVHLKLINSTSSNVTVNVEWLIRVLQY